MGNLSLCSFCVCVSFSSSSFLSSFSCVFSFHFLIRSTMLLYLRGHWEERSDQFERFELYLIVLLLFVQSVAGVSLAEIKFYVDYDMLHKIY